MKEVWDLFARFVALLSKKTEKKFCDICGKIILSDDFHESVDTVVCDDGEIIEDCVCYSCKKCGPLGYERVLADYPWVAELGER